jgi:hypothetical protein
MNWYRFLIPADLPTGLLDLPGGDQSLRIGQQHYFQEDLGIK